MPFSGNFLEPRIPSPLFFMLDSFICSETSFHNLVLNLHLMCSSKMLVNGYTFNYKEKAKLKLPWVLGLCVWAIA